MKGLMLVLKAWEIGKSLQELAFTTAPIWLEIHGLQLGRMTHTMAIFLASKAGEVIAVDVRSQLHVWGTSYPGTYPKSVQ